MDLQKVMAGIEKLAASAYYEKLTVPFHAKSGDETWRIGTNAQVLLACQVGANVPEPARGDLPPAPDCVEFVTKQAEVAWSGPLGRVRGVIREAQWTAVCSVCKGEGTYVETEGDKGTYPCYECEGTKTGPVLPRMFMFLDRAYDGELLARALEPFDNDERVSLGVLPVGPYKSEPEKWPMVVMGEGWRAVLMPWRETEPYPAWPILEMSLGA